MAKINMAYVGTGWLLKGTSDDHDVMGLLPILRSMAVFQPP